jgi:hypothetical protein
MRDYGKISTSIWNSQKFRSLQSDDARLAYFYLHTCPHVNSVGCFVLRDGYAAADLGWAPERYRKAMDSLSIANLIAIDRVEDTVRIVDFLRHDPLTNPKHASGAVKLAMSLPAGSQKLHVLQDLIQSKHIKDAKPIQLEIERLSIGYRKGIDTQNPNPNPNPSLSEADASGAAAPPNPDPVKVMFDAGLGLLTRAGVADREARAIVGKWRKQSSTEAVIAALGRAQREGAIDPVGFVEGVLRFQSSGGRGGPVKAVVGGRKGEMTDMGFIPEE